MARATEFYNSPKKAIDHLRRLREGPCTITQPVGMDPLSKLTKEEQERVKASFHLWWDSWVAPAINCLDRRVNPPKKETPK